MCHRIVVLNDYQRKFEPQVHRESTRELYGTEATYGYVSLVQYLNSGRYHGIARENTTFDFNLR